jgi:hypothetical protein
MFGLFSAFSEQNWQNLAANLSGCSTFCFAPFEFFSLTIGQLGTLKIEI